MSLKVMRVLTRVSDPCGLTDPCEHYQVDQMLPVLYLLDGGVVPVSATPLTLQVKGGTATYDQACRRESRYNPVTT